MTVNRTTLLDLPLPVTGTESGTWGDTTNNGLTQYLDIAIAGSLVLSADSDTTLSSTEGDSSATNIGGTTAQYAVLRCTGARTTTRNINAPAWAISGGTISNYSKTYVVINDTTGGQSIVLRATNSATPTYTTGVTIVAGEKAVCAWNGSDFVKVGGAAGGTNTQVQFNDNGVFGGDAGLVYDKSTDTLTGVNVNATTIDTTNIEVTNIKAKDGTAAASIADSTGVITSVKDQVINGLTVGRGASAVSTNTAVGASALAVNATGGLNTAIGQLALQANTDGGGNVAVGRAAMFANTTGNDNSAFGSGALDSNTTGSFNVAIGQNALQANTFAFYNTAVGYQSLYSNTNASNNTAVGYRALYSSNRTTSDPYNTAVGAEAGYSGVTSSQVTYIGYQAGYYQTGSIQTAIGYQALVGASGVSTGNYNVAVGNEALKGNTTSEFNVGVGYRAGYTNTSGQYNTALGAYALNSNTTASSNTAVGYQAGYSNTTGASNTAVGYQAGYAITTGNYNVAIGRLAMQNSAGVTSDENTAIGNAALRVLTSGASNTAIGSQALSSNTTASNNTAVGYQALYVNTTGADNTAVGYRTLYANVTGINNVAVGKDALAAVTKDGNTAIGVSAGSGISTGRYNTALGLVAATAATYTGDYNTSVGYNANPSSASASGDFTLGDSNITNLRCNDTSISSLSDARDKTEIVDIPYGLNFLLTVKPRQFKWQTRDGNVKDGQTRLGFIAQELLEATNNKNDVLDLVMENNPERLEAKAGSLLPIMVKAIQDLKSELDTVKAELATLKGV